MKKNSIFFGVAFVLVGIVGSYNVQAQNVSVTPSSVSLENAVINVANTAGKAVVSISTEHVEKIKGGKRLYFNQPFGQEQPFGGENDFFRRFFDDYLGEIPDREFKQSGLGSGVIINAEGYILTNEHVIDEADKITVTLPDGREFKGEVKGRDARSDLAVIKIDAHNLPAVNLGDSDSLKIGEWVVAIGNPFGYAMQNPEPTVTCGVIGALHRSLGRAFPRDKDYNDLIQTDAAINPGNSGGPLVNLKGEVVGVNVAIFSTSGGYQGVGFAIPINNAKRIINRLIEGKKIMYGWLAVTVQDMNDDLAKYFGSSDKSGVLVAKVLEDGPAKKAGMKEGDIIKQFDAKAVSNVRELIDRVSKTEVNKKVKINIIRDKKPAVLEVQIGSRPESTEEEEAVSQAESEKWRGLSVEELTEESAMRYRSQEKKGLIVVDVEPGSPSDAAGLTPGEIILEINRQPIKSLADYQKATKPVKADVLVKTQRGYFLVKEK